MNRYNLKSNLPKKGFGFHVETYGQMLFHIGSDILIVNGKASSIKLEYMIEKGFDWSYSINDWIPPYEYQSGLRFDGYVQYVIEYCGEGSNNVSLITVCDDGAIILNDECFIYDSETGKFTSVFGVELIAVKLCKFDEFGG